MKIVVVTQDEGPAGRMPGRIAPGAVELVQFVADNPEDAAILTRLREKIDPARVEASLNGLLLRADQFR